MKSIMKLANKFRIKIADENDSSPEGKIQNSYFFQSLKDWSSSNNIKTINFNVSKNKFVEVKFNDAKIIPVKEKEFKNKFESLIINLIQPFEGWVTIEF
jgi:hypothetical protein